MTGFGLGKAVNADYDVTVEMKSLNSKFLEFSIKLPRNYFEEELMIKNLLTKDLIRGKISANVNVEVLSDKAEPVTINHGIAKSYFREIEALRKELGLHDSPSLSTILNLPDVVANNRAEMDPGEWAMIEKAIREAVKNLVRSRTEEGASLEADLRERCRLIEDFLSQIAEFEEARITTVRSRIQQNLNQLVEPNSINQDRFEQELIYYLEKFDISEEKVRLKMHLNYFLDTLALAESNGKKLGFIAQELGREINTLGAKANDASIQKLVVQMKEELEKIKEQVMNVL